MQNELEQDFNDFVKVGNALRNSPKDAAKAGYITQSEYVVLMKAIREKSYTMSSVRIAAKYAGSPTVIFKTGA